MMNSAAADHRLLTTDERLQTPDFRLKTQDYCRPCIFLSLIFLSALSAHSSFIIP
jgi:hypothetical protein